MSEPIQLSDLVRKTAIVPLGDGTHFEIRGLTAREIFHHLETYPILRTVSIGGNLNMTAFLAETPGALSAWVASACGRHRDPEAERIVSEEMTIDLASELAEASLALTFSRGFGPFAARLMAAAGFITAAPTPAPVTASPRPSPRAASPSTSAPSTSPPASSPPSSTSTTEESASPKPE